MVNLLKKYEDAQTSKLLQGKEIPAFRVGDVVSVKVKIADAAGNTERVQAFEGLCIAIKKRGINSSFTVRKISHGEGVERVFPLQSPRIDSIDIVRRGAVRRSKLYYMRNLTGKAARIEERREVSKNNAAAPKEAAKSEKPANKEEAESGDKADKE